VQALLAAPHCERVVATDLNERALAFAECNATLNGVTNIEFRAGSFFEPVHGECFDLVLSNPPYVISPETELIFRDSGKPGDTVSAELVAELPGHLVAQGYATN
jgi:methylase of polypeptide subunit release factors